MNGYTLIRSNAPPSNFVPERGTPFMIAFKGNDGSYSGVVFECQALNDIALVGKRIGGDSLFSTKQQLIFSRRDVYFYPVPPDMLAALGIVPADSGGKDEQP